MANKKTHGYEGLAIHGACLATLVKDDIVKISANETIAKAGANDKSLGRFVVQFGDRFTVETRFKELIEIKASGVLAANDEVKLAADDGSANQRVTAFVEGTDAESRRFGRVWKGGADAATVKILTYA